MSPVELSEEEYWRRETEAARRFNTAKIRELLDALQPYVDGSFGPINPGHAVTYLRALNELGKLWRVYDKPVPVKPVEQDVQAEQVRLEQRQQEVLAELAKLASIAARRG